MDPPDFERMNFSGILIWCSFYGLILLVSISFLRSSFKKMKDWWHPIDNADKKKITLPNNFLLRSKKSATLAYLFYFCGGMLTGSHHVYLDCPTYAILHQTSLGFLGFGMFFDLILIPYYVWRHNKNRTHERAPKDGGGVKKG